MQVVPAVIGDGIQGGAGKRADQCGVGEESIDGVGECGWIVGGDEQAVFVGANEVFEASDVAGDDGAPAGHGLEDGKREWFGPEGREDACE